MANWTAVDGVQRWTATVSPEQVSDYWDVRYQDPDLHALVTVSWYVVARKGCFGVEQQTEMLIARDLNDPGGTEVWSDTACIAVLGDFSTFSTAERNAAQLAHMFAVGGIYWDGRRA